MIDLPLTKPQREFVFSKATNPAIIGGLGSGKTRAGTIRAILKLLEGRGLNVGYYMPTYDLLKLRAMVLSMHGLIRIIYQRLLLPI